VALVAVLVYAPTWSYDYTYLDDNDLILDQRSFLVNPSSMFGAFGRTYFGGASESYYRPVVNLSFVLDAQWTGTRPFGYHFTNVLLHAAVSVLVLRLCLRLGFGELPALWAALLFVLEPVQVASVAWIVGRNDVIMTGFALGACLLLLRAGERPGLGPKVGHLVCFAAALFSKETALGLPFLCVALGWAIAPEHEPWRRRWPWIGWAGTVALYFGARFAVIGPEHGRGIERIQTASERSAVLLSDLGKLLCPVRPQVLAAPEDLLVWPGVVAIALVAALVWWVRGLRRRIVLLALGFTLVPLLGALAGAKAVVLENRLYLAVVGTSLLGGEVLRALGATMRQKWVLVALASAALGVLGVLGLGYASSFRDREHFSRAAIEGSPHSGLAAHLLSRTLGGRPPLSAPPSSHAGTP
jgi:hypothetical protein